MSAIRWARIVVAGLCWAAVYNAFWAVAWFTYMRRAWSEAFAAIGRPLAWTADVWTVWLIMTVPLGVAVMAHASGTAVPHRGAVRAAVVLLVVFVSGMTVWGLQESLAVRVLVLDAAVNAVATPIAALAAVSLGLGGSHSASRAH